MSHALDMELFLCSITWLITKHCQVFQTIFSFGEQCPFDYFLALFPSPLGWALISTLDPFKAFHLGLPHLHLCAHIPLALRWEVRLFF